jgi:predicted transcriptional regulator of viral defense system
MSDTQGFGPDHGCLFDVAAEQHGYFTAEQAHACGFTWRTLYYHARRGRFLHLRRGLYRLRDFPASLHEEVVMVWLAAGRDEAVVSHQSALDLLDLADVIPDSVHLTVPRSRRGLAVPPGTVVHTTTRPLAPEEIVTLDGLPLTAAARTIVDVAEADLAPDQVERAVANALARGLATEAELRAQACARSGRVTDRIDRALRRLQRRQAVAR